MSTPFATSPHSGPHTPPRGPGSFKYAKSSPVDKPYKCILPKNRDQYQKFGSDDRFVREPFENQECFLLFLNVELPSECPPVPNRCLGGKEDFLELANMVAKFIRDQSEHYLFLYLVFLPTYHFHFRFPRARYPSVPGHGTQYTTWTRYGHRVQARHHGCP